MSSSATIKRMTHFLHNECAAVDKRQPFIHTPIRPFSSARQLPPLVRVIGVLSLVSAVAWLPTHAKAEFRVIDSEVWASGRTHIPPVWIDARQVFFLSAKDFEANENIRSLAIWDVRGNARIYREDVNDFCYRDGTIVYKVVDRSDASKIRGTWFAGKFGHEKPMRMDSPGDIARIRDRLNCHVVANREAVDREGNANREIVSLLSGHGHLDLGALRGEDGAKNTPVTLVRTGALEAIALPFGRYDVHTLPVFFPLQSAYLFKDLFYRKREAVASSKSSTKERRLAWSLGVDGKIVEHLIPDTPWIKGSALSPFLTKRGIGFVNHGGNYDGTDGTYLVVDGKATKLIGGRVNLVGVSPDGCNLAFSQAPDMKADFQKTQKLRTLKVIELCFDRR